MDGKTLQIFIAMVVYILAVIGIGLYYMKRANKNSENFFIGGRGLGPWVAAMSAEASDMSGWLLMGLPGVAYWCGLADALWTAAGLAIGTYINWLIVARRLRQYSVIAGDAITIPDFFSNRFREKKKVIMMIAAIFILVFFTVYAGSCFVTCGKLFSTLFGMPYQAMMIAGALFVIIYTFLGGFLAESASDFMQAIVMILALSGVLIVAVSAAGGLDAVMNNIKSIPGFFEFFGIANPQTTAEGVQIVQAGAPVFGAAGEYGFLKVVSTLSWGLGYFGVPQVLLRFMAIRKSSELKKSRRIATVWCVISLGVAVFLGLVGRVIYPTELLTSSTAENIFIVISTNLLPPLIAGIAMAGILAATISSSDSYLLIAASAVSKNIFQGIFKKDATDKQVMIISRITLLVVAAIGIIIALDENSVIFTIVSFAWAGFGATFGPLLLFSLFWKRTTRAGAIAGMLSGAATVFIWNLLVRPLGGAFDIYELLPAFLVSCIVIVVVSLLTKEPEEEILSDFAKVKEALKAKAD
ncbi:sodium/proline symporter PutP [Christensenellaceae bacterium NSJ-63]|uniref:Sodium/proline symporter n=1 Tax=Guopingia tenuis TaxID=2763656 RepID=A0A926HW73_9FIRM|nr:sodium/proline symporter PutP [Guopingia tenuis]MBC8538053.1 sodium/proline symporter PutP [Guopingia tenuis]MBS5644241.1 sodium/proline symporter PutP [Clostridiales bacterium]